MIREHEVRKAANWGQAVVWAVMVCLVLIALLMARDVWNRVHRPAPFRFTQEVYLPTRGDICPGDTVEWNPRLIVTRTPTVLVLARTLWDSSKQLTVRVDEDPDYFVWTEQEQGAPIQRPVRYTLPGDLPVGLYEIRVGATALNSDAAAYRVPFVIAESCFGGKR